MGIRHCTFCHKDYSSARGSEHYCSGSINQKEVEIEECSACLELDKGNEEGGKE